MPPPRRWPLLFEEEFWDALIQLPGWPASLHAVMMLLAELSQHADQGDLIEDTKVYVAKTVAELPDSSLVRLVVYYTLDDTPNVITVLFVDDYDHPTNPLHRPPHAHRLPKRSGPH